jgi:hypothetical protein
MGEQALVIVADGVAFFAVAPVSGNTRPHDGAEQ